MDLGHVIYTICTQKFFYMGEGQVQYRAISRDLAIFFTKVTYTTMILCFQVFVLGCDVYFFIKKLVWYWHKLKSDLLIYPTVTGRLIPFEEIP